MGTDDILRSLTGLKFENSFNPYVDCCPFHDAKDAPCIRLHHLGEMLERASQQPLDSIWIGRDLGYRGGRRTGLALTDDVHHSAHLKRWDIPVQRPTMGRPVAERTATVIWDILAHIESPVFMWNVFPLHPHNANEPFSNRAHNSRERRAGLEILLDIIKFLEPRRIIAIGNDAYAALENTFGSYSLHKARHPSYGGQNEFLSTMRALYSIETLEKQLDLFQHPHPT